MGDEYIPSPSMFSHKVRIQEVTCGDVLSRVLREDSDV